MKNKDSTIKFFAGILILLDILIYFINDNFGYARLFTVFALLLLFRNELFGQLFK